MRQDTGCSRTGHADEGRADPVVPGYDGLRPGNRVGGREGGSPVAPGGKTESRV